MSLGADRLISLSNHHGQLGRFNFGTASPFSLSLAGGKVAAIYGNSLAIAIPHGGRPRALSGSYEDMSTFVS
jgi:hypothetical protein